MKKILLLLLLSSILVAGTFILADPGPFVNPDGTVCTYLGTSEGPYGPVGDYWCEYTCGCGGGFFAYGPAVLAGI